MLSDMPRGLWTSPELTYTGRIHRTDRARIEPKPDHPIPIWLGTYKPRTLAMTGRLADGWIPSLGFVPPERIGPLRDQVLAAAEAAGRDPAAVAAIYNIVVRVEREPGDQPGVVSGPPAAIAERLAGFTRLGFSGFNLMPSGPDRLEQIEILGGEVLPLLRGAL